MWKIIRTHYILVILVLFSFSILGCSEKVNESKLSEIKVGFSKESVVEILGKPIEVDRYDFQGKTEEAWYYSKDPVASTNQQVIFDAEKGTVIKVIPLE